MKYKIAWNNKFYSWNKIEYFRKKSKLFLPSYLNQNFVVGSNFEEIKNNKVKGVIGYDSAGPLHIGSLLPFLVLLRVLYHYRINDLIVTINDIEAIASRKITPKKSRENIQNIIKVLKNVVERYNKRFTTEIKIRFYIRSKIPQLWWWVCNVVSIPNIEKIIKKHYGKIPLNHLLSVLVMVGEFSRLSKKSPLLTCYGYEELIHLKFIEKIFNILNNNRKLYYIIHLPIKSIKDKNKKMSKSDRSSGLFLIPNDSLYFNKII